MLQNRNISAIAFIIIALWTLALEPLSAKETPERIISFGVHSLAAGSFSNTYFGINGAVLMSLEENTYIEGTMLLHFSRNFVNSYSGIGLYEVF